ncbi:RNA polymerase sporulation-specific sigma factor [Peptoclostridium litorale DSM 5388]|uniref:Uncharacterized protein n=1 Tax=Peptoclostridium litorale DSM 5388 TaxID=1121324 RepID=A0A069RL50_PEPLI|nr:sigma-70 family RNA polymerase sigma factor [Peptoclostridium litorale]KDR94942.1 hypothetical protein CLIT_12c00100 [Peptoclostridium litorale DSM 5388]SIO34004.1 RNA polymerase sporulation-specific sigma factor [Peptoclostridium litorale DSM 5388]
MKSFQPQEIEKYEMIEELAIKASKGCSQSESKLLELFTPLLISKCKFYFGKYDEDLIQDGKVRLIELIRLFDPEKGSHFCGYVKYMISTFYWNAKRHIMALGDVEGVCGSEGDYSSSAISDFSGIEYAELHMLVDSLPSIHKNLIGLVFYEDLTILQASRSMGISYSYALKIKSDAMGMLRSSYFHK